MLGLADAVDYHYLDQSGVIEVEGINDEKDNSMVTKIATQPRTTARAVV